MSAAREHGLWYPPDPSSYEICSIGGNVATNAGGLCCVKYGVTTDYVLGLDVVLADGTLVTLGGKRIKDVAGLSLVKLFVGSEGTLGIVLEAELQLLPLPTAVTGLGIPFPSAADALASVTRRLIAELCSGLAATSLGARRLTLAFYRVDNSTAAVAIGTSRPLQSSDPEERARINRSVSFHVSLGVGPGREPLR